jgi:tRNA(Ile2) C34 agmatinyltransferase TiaS
VQNQVHALVGMGVFSGYVNWDDGVLYSAEAANLRDLERCKYCGGELKLVGKGVISCPFCGTEYFLP